MVEAAEVAFDSVATDGILDCSVAIEREVAISVLHFVEVLRMAFSDLQVEAWRRLHHHVKRLSDYRESRSLDPTYSAAGHVVKRFQAGFSRLAAVLSARVDQGSFLASLREGC